ncbi:MAG: hypothetical protein JW854_05050 [Actinobacteria bacterium]|nr:hypothetical protein [Actinomycetota bacterium]
MEWFSDLKWSEIDVPTHGKSLKELLLSRYEATMTAVEVSVRRRKWTRRIAISLAPIVVAVTIVALILMPHAPQPVSQSGLLAGSSRWYEKVSESGTWEHSLVYVETHKDLMAPEAEGFLYELWVNKESGNSKAIIRDPQSGDALETMIASRMGLDHQVPIIYWENDEEHTEYLSIYEYEVYTDRPEGETSFFERWISDDNWEPFVGKGGTPMGFSISPPFWGYMSGMTMRPGENPLQIDGTFYGMFGQGQLGIDRGELVIQGRKYIAELDREVLETTPDENYIGSALIEDGALVFSMSFLFDPDDYAYLGVISTLAKKGEEIWSDKAIYLAYETTDTELDIGTDGMRLVATVQAPCDYDFEDWNRRYDEYMEKHEDEWSTKAEGDAIAGEELRALALEKARLAIPQAVAAEDYDRLGAIGVNFMLKDSGGEELGYIDIDDVTGNVYAVVNWTVHASSSLNLSLEEAQAIAEEILAREGVDLAAFEMNPRTDDGYLHKMPESDEYIYEFGFMPIDYDYEGRGTRGCVVILSPEDGSVLTYSIY